MSAGSDRTRTTASRDACGRGWSTLGDVGYVDVDGFLHLTDRLSNLTHDKCPRSVGFRAELPRHPTGKLHKRLLKDEY
jgi:acyl-CoA synthetase (AMP-forming)/AMP-acid ligase II